MINWLPEKYNNTINYAKGQILKTSFANKIIDIYLFGSCAKNNIKYNSDVDIAIIIPDNILKDRTIHNEIIKLKGDLSYINDNYAEIDLKIISDISWKQDNSIFIKNIKKDGILI